MTARHDGVAWCGGAGPTDLVGDTDDLAVLSQVMRAEPRVHRRGRLARGRLEAPPARKRDDDVGARPESVTGRVTTTTTESPSTATPAVGSRLEGVRECATRHTYVGPTTLTPSSPPSPCSLKSSTCAGEITAVRSRRCAHGGELTALPW